MGNVIRNDYKPQNQFVDPYNIPPSSGYSKPTNIPGLSYNPSKPSYENFDKNIYGPSGGHASDVYSNLSKINNPPPVSDDDLYGGPNAIGRRAPDNIPGLSNYNNMQNYPPRVPQNPNYNYAPPKVNEQPIRQKYSGGGGDTHWSLYDMQDMAPPLSQMNTDKPPSRLSSAGKSAIGKKWNGTGNDHSSIRLAQPPGGIDGIHLG